MDAPEHHRRLTKFALIALIAWLPIAFIAFALVVCGDAAKAGQFGDFFGSFNCLLSSLAVAGAIYAVTLQIEELRDARRERQKSEDYAKIEEAFEIQRREVAAKSGIAQAQGIMLSEFRNIEKSLQARHLLISALIEKYKGLPNRIRDGQKYTYTGEPSYRKEARDAGIEFVRAGFPNQKFHVAGDLEVDVLLASEIAGYLKIARDEAQEIENSRLTNLAEITKAEKSLKSIIADLERSILLSSSETPHPPASVPAGPTSASP